MDFKQFFLQFWQEIGGASAVLGLAAWWRNRKARQADSDKLNIDSSGYMMEQLERLNIKITELFNKQVEDAQINAELQMKINRLQIECPDCVGKILKIIDNEKGDSE